MGYDPVSTHIGVRSPTQAPNVLTCAHSTHSSRVKMTLLYRVKLRYTAAHRPAVDEQKTSGSGTRSRKVRQAAPGGRRLTARRIFLWGQFWPRGPARLRGAAAGFTFARPVTA